MLFLTHKQPGTDILKGPLPALCYTAVLMDSWEEPPVNFIVHEVQSEKTHGRLQLLSFRILFLLRPRRAWSWASFRSVVTPHLSRLLTGRSSSEVLCGELFCYLSVYFTIWFWFYNLSCSSCKQAWPFLGERQHRNQSIKQTDRQTDIGFSKVNNASQTWQLSQITSTASPMFN